MKQRNIFAVFILSIVTLGIYFLVWLYQIHRDLLKKAEDKKSLPSFLWLFVPFAIIICSFSFLIVAIVSALVGNSANAEVILSAVFSLGILGSMASVVVIGFWWFYRFCQVFYKVVGGTEATVSYVLWIVSCFICLPVWTLIVQNDINNSISTKTS